VEVRLAASGRQQLPGSPDLGQELLLEDQVAGEPVEPVDDDRAGSAVLDRGQGLGQAKPVLELLGPDTPSSRNTVRTWWPCWRAQARQACSWSARPRPSSAMLGTTSALLKEVAGQGAVVRREATSGIVADNLLTVGGVTDPSSLYTFERSAGDVHRCGLGHIWPKSPTLACLCLNQAW
jgi:hypothetical protein